MSSNDDCQFPYTLRNGRHEFALADRSLGDRQYLPRPLFFRSEPGRSEPLRIGSDAQIHRLDGSDAERHPASVASGQSGAAFAGGHESVSAVYRTRFAFSSLFPDYRDPIVGMGPGILIADGPADHVFRLVR